MVEILKTVKVVALFLLFSSAMSFTGYLLLKHGSSAAFQLAVTFFIIQAIVTVVAAKEVINAALGGKHGQ